MSILVIYKVGLYNTPGLLTPEATECQLSVTDSEQVPLSASPN